MKEIIFLIFLTHFSLFSFFLDNSSFSQKLQKCFSFQTIKKNFSLKFTLKKTNFSPFAFFRKFIFPFAIFLKFIKFSFEIKKHKISTMRKRKKEKMKKHQKRKRELKNNDLQNSKNHIKTTLFIYYKYSFYIIIYYKIKN